MKRFQLKTRYRKRFADTVTPVSIYLRLRDKFPGSLLLESADSYRGSENNFSFIVLNPLASFWVQNGLIQRRYPDGSREETPLTEVCSLAEELQAFTELFHAEPAPEVSYVSPGLFGYSSYDAVELYEDIEFEGQTAEHRQIPTLMYQLFQYVIAINHFSGEMLLFEYRYDPGDQDDDETALSTLEHMLLNKDFPVFRFSSTGEETVSPSAEIYQSMVQKGIEHCHRGDVFQIVLSRRFEQRFQGDEFNVYRALRAINPSPYLFYCDYGNFKIFGSSPEAQLVVKSGYASVNPIAGTFRRTGKHEEDVQAAEALKVDPKENAEHMMLVDLGRNDLSRHCEGVEVSELKEIRFYSHVIHLVSTVQGRLTSGSNAVQVLGDCFPAGTLSGAPKYRAMELIDEIEGVRRSFYGGCIGFLGFNGDCNHAIMIRSFLSRDGTLSYQAGAGIVADSVPERELQEVENKIAALRKAVELASEV